MSGQFSKFSESSGAKTFVFSLSRKVFVHDFRLIVNVLRKLLDPKVGLMRPTLSINNFLKTCRGGLPPRRHAIKDKLNLKV
jgi:hypothetical protein